MRVLTVRLDQEGELILQRLRLITGLSISDIFRAGVLLLEKQLLETEKKNHVKQKIR